MESGQESLGFSLFELVFGHLVHGPLKLLKDNWLFENTESLNLLDYVSKFRDKLKKAWELAQQNLKNSQSQIKMLCDRKSQNMFSIQEARFQCHHLAEEAHCKPEI